MQVLQFMPFSSVISTDFWFQYRKVKLAKWHSNTDIIKISGTWKFTSPRGTSLNILFSRDSFIDKDSRHSAVQTTVNRAGKTIVGVLAQTRTFEELRTLDNKSVISTSYANDLWESFISGYALDRPDCLVSFLMVTFSGMVDYKFYYWCTFPAFTWPKSMHLCSDPVELKERMTPQQIEELRICLNSRTVHAPFSALVFSATENVKFITLKEYVALKRSHPEGEGVQAWLGFEDSSSMPSNPAWPLRNLLALIAYHCPAEQKHSVVCFRHYWEGFEGIKNKSIVLDIIFEEDLQRPDSIPEVLMGWEMNEKGNYRPKLVDLQPFLDPERLAESALELNLKLMKWRLAPDLNLDVIKKCKCLLFGAGTLGCNVASTLLAWGIKVITFVDYGKLSYSSLMRQPLFFNKRTKEDEHKAVAAAKDIKRTLPYVVSSGQVIMVPMLGQRVVPSREKQVQEDIDALAKLVDEHDALFLLTDSRESRWLPTLLGAAERKMVFTAAVGCDSYVAMRHGIPNDSREASHLGCYFCSNDTSPGDSVSDRSRDQKFTVARPGISMMAAGHVAELLASVLQHQLKGHAPGPSYNSTYEDPAEGVLGLVPHSVRYYMGTLRYLSTSTPAFPQCCACGPRVIEEYKSKGFEFLKKAFNSPSYLEEVSGLDKLHEESVESEICAISGSESEVN